MTARRSKPKLTTRSGAARLERGIKRLSKEIEEIEKVTYGGIAEPEARYFLLERKRDDVVRSTVLQLHTATEDLLHVWLHSLLLGESARDLSSRASARSKTIHELLKGGRAIGFDTKLKLLRSLGLIREPTVPRLTELNRLRNKCSHNWLLKVHIRRGIRRRAPKRPLLQYRNVDLHHAGPLAAFAREFTMLYVRLFMKVYAE